MEVDDHHVQLLSLLPSKITEIYNNDGLNSHLKHDIACRLIANSIGASTASILLYKGNKNHLYCAGRYINPSIDYANARIKSPKTQNRILEVMKYVSVLEFFQYTNVESDIEALYSEYLSCPLRDPIPIGIEEFEYIFLNKQFLAKDYLKYKRHFQEDVHKIELNGTVTGLFYYMLSHFEHKEICLEKIASKKMLYYDQSKILIVDLEKISARSKTCCENLRKKLNVVIDANAYYVGIPLEVNNRPIGLLRLLINKKIHLLVPEFKINKIEGIHKSNDTESSIVVKREFNDQESVLKYVFETANCKTLALIEALHLNNAFYGHGMRQIALKDNLHADFSNLNNVANELTEVVNCYGCIIRYSDNKQSKASIRGFSDSIYEYSKQLSKNGDPYVDSRSERFKIELLDLFYSDMQPIVNGQVIKVESVKVEFVNKVVDKISYQYFDEKYHLRSSTEWKGRKFRKLYKGIENIFNLNQSLFAFFDITSIIIVPIKDKEYGIVTLANTSNIHTF